jgi:hypothetical protein
MLGNSFWRQLREGFGRAERFVEQKQFRPVDKPASERHAPYRLITDSMATWGSEAIQLCYTHSAQSSINPSMPAL